MVVVERGYARRLINKLQSIPTLRQQFRPPPLQRGLYISMLYRERTHMLIRCYSSHATEAVQEQLWSTIQKDGWISATPIRSINYYYIPESLLAWALLIDSTLRPHPARDYIV
jgi:hypothetical protein